MVHYRLLFSIIRNQILFLMYHLNPLPAPAVTSSVIHCILRDKPPVDVIDEKLFFCVVKAGFAQRHRKHSLIR